MRALAKFGKQHVRAPALADDNESPMPQEAMLDALAGRAALQGRRCVMDLTGLGRAESAHAKEAVGQ
jgi:hypothetical protein